MTSGGSKMTNEVPKKIAFALIAFSLFVFSLPFLPQPVKATIASQFVEVYCSVSTTKDCTRLGDDLLMTAPSISVRAYRASCARHEVGGCEKAAFLLTKYGHAPAAQVFAARACQLKQQTECSNAAKVN